MNFPREAGPNILHAEQLRHICPEAKLTGAEGFREVKPVGVLTCIDSVRVDDSAAFFGETA